MKTYSDKIKEIKASVCIDADIDGVLDDLPAE